MTAAVDILRSAARLRPSPTHSWRGRINYRLQFINKSKLPFCL